jgi:hypothetical protein
VQKYADFGYIITAFTVFGKEAARYLRGNSQLLNL